MSSTQVTALIVVGVLIVLCFILLLAIHIFEKRTGGFDGVEGDSTEFKPRHDKSRSNLK